MCAAVVTGFIGWILLRILLEGVPQLSFHYLTTLPADSGRAGGILPVVISTVLILAIAITAAVPISVATAAWLASDQHGGTRVRVCLDLLAAVPSIVFGLFGNAFFCVTLGMGYSLLAGGLTLACMILPIVTRTCERALTDVPLEQRQAAAALGLSAGTTLFRVVLPMAAPSIAAGVVLGIGRAVSETAALLFTAGYVLRMPATILDSGRAISVHIFDLAMNIPNGASRAMAAAAVLMILLLMINSLATAIIHWLGHRMTLHSGAAHASH